MKTLELFIEGAKAKAGEVAKELQKKGLESKYRGIMIDTEGRMSFVHELPGSVTKKTPWLQESVLETWEEAYRGARAIGE